MRNSRTLRMVVACALLLPTALLAARILAHGVRPKQVVTAATLPAQIGSWNGTDVPLTDAEAEMLETPGWSQRIYVNQVTGDRVQVLLLQVDNTQNAHDPKLCMQGSGFALAGETTESVSGNGDKAMKASFSKGDERIVMLSWLQTPNGTIPDLSAGMKLKGIMQALHGERLDGVAVRVIALPNSLTGRSADGETSCLALWNSISHQIDFPKLVANVHQEGI